MSAATGFAKQEDGLEKLLKLATLDADKIRAAGEEHRRQIQLTQAEEAKVAEARAYIAKHTTLASDLQSREDALVVNQTAHADNVAKHMAHVTSENTRLEAFAAKLAAQDKASEEMAAKAQQAAKDAAALKASYEQQHQTAMQDIQSAQNANIAIGGKLAAENQRLTDWEATLKRKAELLRQQMANF